MADKKLLDMKNKKKSRNPRFSRQDSHKKKGMKRGWRKPRGGDSKKRLRMQRRSLVSPGYGTPKELRGNHKSGLAIVRVKSKEDIKKIDPKKQGAIVAGKLGLRKKLPLLKELQKNKITVLNISDVDNFIKEKETYLKKRKEIKKEEKKEEKKKEEKKEKEESIEDKLSEEDKKKLEKEEIDRLLTKKF